MMALRATGQFAPLVGTLIGACGGLVYWVGVQVWPSNVAVILSMASTALLTARLPGGIPAARLDASSRLLCLLIKYNALMALSAAKLPFDVPANVPLGFIMLCGYAASFALPLPVTALRPAETAPLSSGTLALALAIGFVPAALLGIPGLVGLAAATLASMGILVLLRVGRAPSSQPAPALTQSLTEVCFYLGALATWRYV